MKKLLLLLLPATLLFSCQPENPDDPTVPVEEYSSHIVGEWRLESTMTHYTPVDGSGEETYDNTGMDEKIVLKFKADKTMQETDEETGQVWATYDYTISGENLKLVDKSSSDVSNLTILTLNNEMLKLKTNDGGGQDLLDDNDNLLGTIKYNVSTLKKK